MKTLLRLLALLVAVPVVVVVAASFADGPWAVIPGGPLRAGELVEAPVADWSFAADVQEIELQLLEPPRSRTVWIVVHDGAAYIPCGFLDVPLWKQWPHQAREDGRALLRIEGRRYPVSLAKVDDPETLDAVSGLARLKYAYGGEGPPDPDVVWFFRATSR